MRQDLTLLTDEELISSLKTLVRDERRRLVAILRHLAEMDHRRLADKQGYPSLFDYCVRELRYAEGEAARRIHAARAAARFPGVYRALDRGLLTLTTLSMLAPHLRWDNYRRILRRAWGRNKRSVEKLVASIVPAPERPERIRFLGPAALSPQPKPDKGLDCGAEHQAEFGAALQAAVDAAPQAAADAASQAQAGTAPQAQAGAALVPEPGIEQRVEFVFTGNEALLQAVERARALLRHKYPRASYAEIFAEAVRVLLERIDPDGRPARRTRHAPGPPTADDARRMSRSDAGTRAVPARVKREVRRRDGGRCSFVGSGGQRCETAAGLEYDHLLPWARGGRSDDPANVRLLCRRHNDLEARRAFGDAFVDSAIARRRREIPSAQSS